MRRWVVCLCVMVGLSNLAEAGPSVAMAPDDSDESRNLARSLTPLLQDVTVVAGPGVNPESDSGNPPKESADPRLVDFLLLIHIEWRPDSVEGRPDEWVGTFKVVNVATSETVYHTRHTRPIDTQRTTSMNSPLLLFLVSPALAIPLIAQSIAADEARAIHELAAASADGLNAFFKTATYSARETVRVYPEIGQ